MEEALEDGRRLGQLEPVVLGEGGREGGGEGKREGRREEWWMDEARIS